MDSLTSAVPVTLHRRVQFVTMLQMAECGMADLTTVAAICPGADRRDFEAALAFLLDESSIQGPHGRLSSLVALAEAGQLTLTGLGRRRLAEDDV